MVEARVAGQQQGESGAPQREVDEVTRVAVRGLLHRRPRALGALDRLDDLAALEVGKRADVIVVDRDRPHLAPGPDPYATLVYAARGSDVRTTIVDGEILVDDFAPLRVDARAVAAEARAAARELAARAGLDAGPWPETTVV